MPARWPPVGGWVLKPTRSFLKGYRPVVLVASAVSLAIAALGPLLLSRDIYTYAAYGRMRVLYHHNPYVSTLAAFPHDPFVAVASSQWRHTHAPYGPVFTLLSAAIAR